MMGMWWSRKLITAAPLKGTVVWTLCLALHFTSGAVNFSTPWVTMDINNFQRQGDYGSPVPLFATKGMRHPALPNKSVIFGIFWAIFCLYKCTFKGKNTQTMNLGLAFLVIYCTEVSHIKTLGLQCNLNACGRALTHRYRGGQWGQDVADAKKQKGRDILSAVCTACSHPRYHLASLSHLTYTFTCAVPPAVHASMTPSQKLYSTHAPGEGMERAPQMKSKKLTAWAREESTFILGNGAFYSCDPHPCGPLWRR